MNDMPDPSMNRVSGTADACAQRCFPGQERGDRGALGPGHVRGDPESAADRLHRDPRVVVDHERPAQHAHACRARVRDVEAAVGQRAVIARSDDQVPAALAPVRARQAEVGDPPEPHVVDRAQDPRRRAERRHVDHHRPGGQVDEAEEVDRVAVRRSGTATPSPSAPRTTGPSCPPPRSTGTPGGWPPATRRGKR